MYPHADGNRRRRVGLPPGQMPPQHNPHMMGMAQQAPGVMLPVRNQPVQILQQSQHHYSAPQQYSTGQQVNQHQQYVNSPPPVPAPFRAQLPTQQLYSHNNTQVVLTKQAVNHNKHYRADCKPIKENAGVDSVPLNNYLQTYSEHSRDQDQSFEEETMAHPVSNDPGKKDEERGESLHTPDSTSNNDATPSTAYAGVKEKTPMCLVNELARFNKITHQYRLTQEQGPAHKKSFTVTLTLGQEEYTAEGQSIKKAQHAAAADALRKTVYTHPAPKNNKFLPIGKGNMTPTVELNALAMKRGEPAIYKIVEFPSGHGYQTQNNYGYRRPLGMRGGYYGRGRGNSDMRTNRYQPRPNYVSNYNAFGVVLKVGDKEFLGEGSTPQLARHDAASKALAHLRLLPQPENVPESACTNDVLDDQDLDSSIKSPISLVHEIALKRNFNIIFNVLSEKGPPHMKTFVTQCIVGEFKCEGEGNGKKISKKRAAENMLQELKKLPPLSPSLTCSVSITRLKRKAPQTKKKTRNLIKVTQEPKPEVEVTEEMNPISRLIQIQQVKKEREPVYTLLEEKGIHRRREFIMEVAIGHLKATGTGPNKKVAKKNAAQNLLNIIEGTTSEGPSSAVAGEAVAKTKKGAPVSGGGRQLAPGILLVNDQTKFSSSEINPVKVNSEMNSGPSGVKAYPKGFGPKEQLLYLSKVLNFEVNFSDYPKASHRDHLTLVSISTEPPQVCHGCAPTMEDAHNEAAATALRALSAMGLECPPSDKEKK